MYSEKSDGVWGVKGGKLSMERGEKMFGMSMVLGEKRKKKFFLKEIVKNENVKCRNELIR